MSSVGLLVSNLVRPERIRETASLGEKLGFSEIWLAEDYFFTTGISSASAALSSTDSVIVGTGIVSALVRHPAVLAMEISTLTRMYPGRFVPGIALGVRNWLRQMGLDPKSPLTAVRECVSTVRALLRGEEVTFQGTSFTCEKIKLEFPAFESVPIYMGAFGPKMLQITGEIADGTIVGLMTSKKYLQWAREQISIGAARVGRKNRHHIVAFMFFSVGSDSRKTKEAVRGPLSRYLLTGSGPGLEAAYDIYGITEQLKDMAARGGADVIEREMPRQWLEALAVIGEPEECAAKILGFFEAGADSVVLMPMPPERALDVVELAAKEVLPLL